MDPRNGSGYVAELGPDTKERWRITNLSNPYDALALPDGTVAVAEMNVSSVSIRDTAGRVLSQKNITGGAARRVSGSPQQLQLLPDGDFLVVCRNAVVDMKRDKAEQTVVYDRSMNYDITSAARLANGETAVLLQNNGPDHLVFLDKAGKEIADRKIKTGAAFYQSYIAGAGEDRVLISESQKVVEYDVKEQKAVWSHPTPNARCLQRLANGNTLIVEGNVSADNANRVVEVTPGGEEVWSHRLAGGLTLFRAYRR